MKTTIKFLTALLFVLTTSVFYGQNRGIAYQALIFKPEAKIYPGVSHSNTPLVDTEVCLRFTFTDVRKNVEYQEIIKIKTDNYGLVNTTIGTGQQIDGYVASFDQITWGSERKMLMVELDVTGNCTSFDIISNEPFLTVPFAQVANTISGVVGIANGGTGATNSTDARLNLGLNNVNNTSDLNKPISIATQAALNGKENTSNKSTDGTLSSNSDIKFPTEKAVKTYVDSSKSTLNTIILNSVTSPAGTSEGQMAYNANASSGLPVGPIFWNGTKWQAASTNSATNTTEGVLKLAGDLGGTANAPTVPGLTLKEDTSNKSTDGTLSSNSDIKFPTEKAVKTYVDSSKSTLNTIILNSVTSPAGTSEGQMAYNANASSGLPVGPIFWNGTKWQAASTNSATNTTEGVLKLAGDLGGTANAPTVPGLTLKEDTSNKSTDGTLSSNSDIKFPTEKAVKTYVDNSSTSAKGLQGTPISSSTPLTGQILRFDGTNWVPQSLSSFLKTGTIEVDATVAQTKFSVPTNAIGIIAFYINGVRLPKDAISISGADITYDPANNGSYSISAQDRITYDYIY